MHRFGLAIPIFLALVLCGTPKCSGGSIVQEHLGEVREVAILVDMAGFRFDPIPGLDVQDLGRKISRRLASILKAQQICVVENSERQVVVTVDKSWGSRDRDQIAILVELELREPVRLGGTPKDEGKETIKKLSTWRDRRVSLVRTSEVAQTVFDEVEIEAMEFADKVVQARTSSGCSRAPRSGSTSTPREPRRSK